MFASPSSSPPSPCWPPPSSEPAVRDPAGGARSSTPRAADDDSHGSTPPSEPRTPSNGGSSSIEIATSANARSFENPGPPPSRTTWHPSRSTARHLTDALRQDTGMTLRPVLVNMKALDDSAVGRFWAEALGWSVTGEGSGATAATRRLRLAGSGRRVHRRHCRPGTQDCNKESCARRSRHHLCGPRRSWSRASKLSVRRPPTWARVTCRGRVLPTRRVTSSASSPDPDNEP